MLDSAFPPFDFARSKGNDTGSNIAGIDNVLSQLSQEESLTGAGLANRMAVLCSVSGVLNCRSRQRTNKENDCTFIHLCQ